MAIIHDGEQIPGTWRAPDVPPPELTLIIVPFPGLVGEFALNGRTKGREISITGLLHSAGYTSSLAIRAMINKLNDSQHVGRRGQLVVPISSTDNWTYADVTFRGFQMLAPGPIIDYAGNLHNDRTVWVCPGVLYFRQHTVND